MVQASAFFEEGLDVNRGRDLCYTFLGEGEPIRESMESRAAEY